MSNSISERTKFVTNETIRRLVADITSLKRNPLTKQGIYYEHDSQDMLVGRAMIIGPENTPYAHGFYFFEFAFPFDYPLHPPQLQYLTNDGKTRFHPNFYRNGKVCLSLLNTWRGEGWTSCQTIRSVLITLVSILDKTPLLNEPNVIETNPDVKIYNQIIHFNNLKFAHTEMLTGKPIPYKFKRLFYPVIKIYGLEHSKKVIDIIEAKIKNQKKIITVKTRMYGLYSTINYSSLLIKVQSAHKQFLSITDGVTDAVIASVQDTHINNKIE